MQGLADGYFVIPYTLGNYFASTNIEPINTDAPDFAEAENQTKKRVEKLLGVKGKRTVDSFHKELGKIMWDKCGMARTKEGLTEALEKIPKLREEFWQNVNVLGENESYNVSLEKAGRVADFLEYGELMCQDAHDREESAGGHFREEHQTEDGEAKRNDEKFCHVAVWEHKGEGQKAQRHQEELEFENVALATRSYK